MNKLFCFSNVSQRYPRIQQDKFERYRDGNTETVRINQDIQNVSLMFPRYRRATAGHNVNVPQCYSDTVREQWDKRVVSLRYRGYRGGTAKKPLGYNEETLGKKQGNCWETLRFPWPFPTVTFNTFPKLLREVSCGFPTGFRSDSPRFP